VYPSHHLTPKVLFNCHIENKYLSFDTNGFSGLIFLSLVTKFKNSVMILISRVLMKLLGPTFQFQGLFIKNDECQLTWFIVLNLKNLLNDLIHKLNTKDFSLTSKHPISQNIFHILIHSFDNPIQMKD
jgi:hypothetical protein